MNRTQPLSPKIILPGRQGLCFREAYILVRKPDKQIIEQITDKYVITGSAKFYDGEVYDIKKA